MGILPVTRAHRWPIGDSPVIIEVMQDKEIRNYKSLGGKSYSAGVLVTQRGMLGLSREITGKSLSQQACL